MRRLMQTAALALAGAVSACAPHPIVVRDPQPPPSPAEAYECGTMRLPLNNALSDCSARYREQPQVLRSRG